MINFLNGRKIFLLSNLFAENVLILLYNESLDEIWVLAGLGAGHVGGDGLVGQLRGVDGAVGVEEPHLTQHALEGGHLGLEGAGELGEIVEEVDLVLDGGVEGLPLPPPGAAGVQALGLTLQTSNTFYYKEAFFVWGGGLV